MSGRRGEVLPHQPTTDVDPQEQDLQYLARRFIAKVTALPTASDFYRGKEVILLGASGVADTHQVCLKAAAGTYSWKVIATG